MTKLVLKIISKKYSDLSNPIARTACSHLTCSIGILSNILLAILKLALGAFSNSISIFADGINNVSDASSSLISLIGLKLASRPEDESHPYGHARIEYIAGIIISFVIIFVGFFLLQSSIGKILNPSDLTFSYIVLLSIFLSILIKLWQSKFYKKIGTLINSNPLLATSIDSRNDVIATTTVFFGLLVWKFFGINLDGMLGIFVAIFIIWSGIQLVRETSSPLLGESPSKELVEQITAISFENPKVLGIHDIMIHNYGPNKTFSSFHIEIDGKNDIYEIHSIATDIEEKIKSLLHIDCVTHIDPVQTDNPIRADLLQIVQSALLDLDGIIDVHDLRIVPEQPNHKLIFDVSITFDCKYLKHDLYRISKSAIQEKYPNYYIVITVDQK